MSKTKKMKKFLLFIFIVFFLHGCVGTASKGVFGTGVSIAFDPRTVGTQIDDSIMQKNLQITKMAWETKGTRSVRNDIKIKEKFNF